MEVKGCQLRITGYNFLTSPETGAGQPVTAFIISLRPYGKEAFCCISHTGL